ncbi:MAG: phosphoribosylformylglycinamidine cyclo-ligase [Bacteroidota bacterium]|nr:phosphoribosylformylglycinamidine cyclo-ligase [Candidatus Kapabacteria bacterium]MDW8219840.1 phosphoribosylformylglycinamidine cyclo-ligase [Bacteroidota bacterium]
MDYTTAGVNIQVGEELVERIKPLVRSTFTPHVLTDIGLFGACFDARFPEYEHPVLVSSVDGVGTKVKIAIMMSKHDTIGQCLVNHCVNDILACGASPLYFMDYFATGKLSVSIAEHVIRGFAIACRENGCALIGGETAEMPSMYNEGEYDIAGTIVGVVEKAKMLRSDAVQKGDILLGLASTGLHTNGYSLARSVLFPRFRHDTYIDDLATTLGEALLAIHRSYAQAIKPILERPDSSALIHGLAHITGGGIVGNVQRVVPRHLTLAIDWSSWTIPPLFTFIQREGRISDEEMRRVFNLGIGYVLIVPEHHVDTVTTLLPERSFVIGRVVQQ